MAKLKWQRFGRSEFGLHPNVQTKNLTVLVHGLNCKSVKPYWGNLPDLLCAQLGQPTDILLWAYDTNLSAFDRVRALFKRKAKLATARAIGSSLFQDLRGRFSCMRPNSYEGIAILGHSQGGLVSINAVFETLSSSDNVPIRGFCAASMPTTWSGLAKAHSLATLGTNPQTSYLGSKRDYLTDVETKMPMITKAIPTFYIRAIGDEVIGDDQKIHLFRQNSSIQGPHNWQEIITLPSDPGFSEIKDFLERALL